jgi:hypothetical protein
MSQIEVANWTLVLMLVSLAGCNTDRVGPWDLGAPNRAEVGDVAEPDEGVTPGDVRDTAVDIPDVPPEDTRDSGRDTADTAREDTMSDATPDTTPDACRQQGEATGTGSFDDPDGDGIPAVNDNCPETANPGQKDTDADGLGEACDEAPKTACRSCVRDGDQCGEDEDCCDGRCTGEGVCEDYCSPTGGVCREDSDCCGGLCSVGGDGVGGCFE